MDQKICPDCQFVLPQASFFCPNCGKKLQEPPVKTSLGKQIGLYAFSILLPPFGLFPGIKYIRQKDQKARYIGAAILILTIISTIVSIWIAAGILERVNQEINRQFQDYSNIGL